MPTAPPRLTFQPLSTRALPPRSQTTILPRNDPALAGSRHLPLRTTGAGPAPAVMEAPLSTCPLLNVSVASKARVWVDAATVVTHGARWLTVPSPGPEFPADAATKTPAA